MKRSLKKLGGVTATATLALFAVQSQAQNVTENFSSDLYSSEFSAAANPLSPSQSLTGGPGGAGYLSGVTGDGNAIYQNQTWDFSQSGETIQESILSQYTTASGGGGQFQLGIGAPNFVMSGAGGSTPAFSSFRLSTSTTGPENVKAEYQVDNGSGTITGGQSVATTLTLGDWYLFAVTFDNIGSGSYTMTANLYNYGGTGTTPSSIDLLTALDGTGTPFEQSVTLSGSPLTTATDANDLYAGFRVNQPSTSGFGEFTDFDVLDPAPAPVPEPGVMALFGLSALLGVRQLRCK